MTELRSRADAAHHLKAPTSSFTRSSSAPGTCNKMRLPCAWITGSFVPVSSTRRRMVSMDFSCALFSKACCPAQLIFTFCPTAQARARIKSHHNLAQNLVTLGIHQLE